VKTTLPEEYRIVRIKHPDPLQGIPKLPERPPDFVPGRRYTQERYEAHKAAMGPFLWPEEEKLAHELVRLQEDAFAWEETEKGRFKDEYFAPVMIPTIEHVPWALRNIPIPPGIYDRVIKIIREKMESGVYEPSNASYRSRWFCVLKKDGTALRLVHDLQPLNQVTIADSGLPPFAEQYAEGFAGRACYGSLDLFVSFDQRTLDERSRDMTTFQSPLGTLRLTSVPMGYTNAMQIMHGDVTHVLQDEIPHVTAPFVDDVPVKGPETRYELRDGGYETIPGNPGIRRFVWEHMENMNRVLQLMKAYGGTFNGKKLVVCAPETLVVGHMCCYEGRIADRSYVQKIEDWPEPETVTHVRSFLGTCGVLRIFIRNYASIVRKLVDLTRKDAEWRFGPGEREAMIRIKDAIKSSPALRPIDYTCGRRVIMAVDSSYIAVGFVLLQLGEDDRRYPARFGSIPWNERESRYSQAKLELYGLFRSLRAFRLWLIGLPKFTVETDASYIKGMLNNPDIQPGAAVNRWIAGILLFDFDLVHVPAAKHAVADGLSRRPPAPGEREAEEDDPEDWIDQAHGFAIEAMNWDRPRRVFITVSGRQPTRIQRPGESREVFSISETREEIPRNGDTIERDEYMESLRKFLMNPTENLPEGEKERRKVLRAAHGFFVLDDRLWKRRKSGHHQLYLPPEKRMEVIRQAHDDLGHKGTFVIRARVSDRFWWPTLDFDVRWFVRTCHQCQIRQLTKVVIPPTVAAPASLFRKAYMDSMVMPKAGGYRTVVQARCSLSGYVEGRRLRTETGETIAAFIFEDILCRWGAVEEIVTDNGGAFVKALEILGKRYKIFNIRISAYNSRANGLVERAHRPVRESLMKAAGGIEAKWPEVFHSVLWAERVTIQRATGYSPYWIAHGVEPLFPFDLAEATYLAPALDAPMSTEDLLAVRARQLQKREEDLEMVKTRILQAREVSARKFMEKHETTIRDYDFKPGDMVLVRNSAIEKDLNRKSKPRYLGPMVVIRKTDRGAYVLSELDGAVAKSAFAAFRLVPYFARPHISQPITFGGTAGMDEEESGSEEDD
jgi:hypothetical protein